MVFSISGRKPRKRRLALLYLIAFIAQFRGGGAISKTHLIGRSAVVQMTVSGIFLGQHVQRESALILIVPRLGRESPVNGLESPAIPEFTDSLAPVTV